ncbi:hypothetical protein B566_EDAN008065 [Ephemera danica]|nr:hypothetical protein B566_EDAN008065 [Ephemera danica]
MQDVQVALSGNFSCEVSADAPSFSTAFVSQYMTVVDLPEKRPVISVEKTSFQAGQLLNANCTTVKSRPAANLTFYINDVPVSIAVTPTADEMLQSRRVQVSEEYLEHSDKEMASTMGSWLSVRAPVPQQAGPLRLKCVASVLMFHRHAELVLEEERPQLLVLGAREQPGASAASISAAPPVNALWNQPVIL